MQISDAVCKFKFKTEKAIMSSPCIDKEKSKLYVGGLDGFFYCFSLLDNERIAEFSWKFDTGKPIFSSPSVHFNTGLVIIGIYLFIWDT